MSERKREISTHPEGKVDIRRGWSVMKVCECGVRIEGRWRLGRALRRSDAVRHDTPPFFFFSHPLVFTLGTAIADTFFFSSFFSTEKNGWFARSKLASVAA